MTTRPLVTHHPERRPLHLHVNGEWTDLDVEPRRSLADTLRDQLGLTGTHLGCEQGVCGTCTVLLDGEPVRSCLILAVQADGHAVRTVESLAAPDGGFHPLQEAFGECHALQCGFCTPGFLMLLAGTLEATPTIDDHALAEVVSSNLCRCTGYEPIVAAARLARDRGVPVAPPRPTPNARRTDAPGPTVPSPAPATTEAREEPRRRWTQALVLVGAGALAAVAVRALRRKGARRG